MAFYDQLARYYEKIFPFRQEVLDFLTDLIPGSGKHVLDLGCGVGIQAAALAEIGHGVWAIDTDGAMIERAVEKYPGVHFEKMDMRRIGELDRRFDLIFSLGNVLSHLSAEDLRNFLPSLRDSLHPGGTWVFQVVNWDFILTQTEHTFPVKKIPEERLEFFRSYGRAAGGKIHFKSRLEREGQPVFSEETLLFPLSSETYLDIHRRSGFTVSGHYGDFKKGAYHTDRNCANIFVFGATG